MSDDGIIINDKSVLDVINKLLKKAAETKDTHHIIALSIIVMAQALANCMDDLPINECQHAEGVEIYFIVVQTLLENDSFTS